MRPKTTISISEARKRIFDIAEEVQRPGVYYTFTEKGKPKMVVMSAEEFESWMETLDVLEEFPNLDKDIEETEQSMKTGEYKTWTTLEQLLAKEGFFVADKSKNKYAIPTQNKAQRGKRAKKNS